MLSLSTLFLATVIVESYKINVIVKKTNIEDELGNLRRNNKISKKEKL